MTLSSGTRLGPYEILAPLGAGGMGEVYRARDPRLAREVEIKVLPEAFFEGEERRQRFEREARLLAALNHPGIAAIYSFEEIPSSSSSSTRHILVMELVEGDGLDRRISSGSLSLEESLSLARQIAEALEAAHEKGIVHRDLKPANVKVTPDGRVKLLDFGLAKIFESEATVSNPSISYSPTLTARGTAAGVILGTAAYMSPEQARGKPVDKRTDVWAFGCVLFEMLAGRRVFEGETVSDTLAAILRGEPDWAALPAETPEKVREILRKCLRRDAKQRLHDIADARLDLEEAQAAPRYASGLSTAAENLQTGTPGPAGASATRPSRGGGGRTSLSVFLPWALAAVFAVAAGALALRARAPHTPAPVTRFELRPPDGTSFSNALALSADGRQVAFTATDDKGVERLYVRALDEVQARVLSGTEGARFPFWSPDGSAIGFFSQERLMRVASSGGTVLTLCPAADGRGGAWSPENVILFTPNIRLPLHRVSASGGAATPRTVFAKGDFTHRWPKFLPDGKRFVYLALSEEAGKSGVYLASLDHPAGTLVVESRGKPDFADGRLLYVREDTLFAQRAEGSALTLRGEPAPLADGLTPEGESGWTGLVAFAAAPDGTLVYRRRAQPKLRLTWFDRAGKALGTLGEPGQFAEPEFVPGGRRVVLGVVDPKSSFADIWQVDLSRDAWSRLTFGPKNAVSATTSPDGLWLYFSSNRDGRMGVYRRPLAGTGGDELLYKGNADAYLSFVTKDGASVVFEAFGVSPRNEIWTLPLKGDRKPSILLSMPASSVAHPGISPDGTLLAYTSDETGRPEVYVQTLPPTGAKWQVSTAGGDQPRFSDDGREIFFVSRDRKLMAAPLARGNPLEIGPARELFPLRVPPNSMSDYRTQYAAAPDGQRFLVLVLAGDRDDAPAIVTLNGLGGPR
jgi:Tol biopolymer transport system component